MVFANELQQIIKMNASTSVSNTSITRRLEFDAGHRIPNHDGQCKHLHGHRYAIEITLSGEILTHPGMADDGMVLDFGDIKRLASKNLVDIWDHAFLVAEDDLVVVNFLKTIPDHKTVLLDRVPTVENLAYLAFTILKPIFSDAFGDRLYLSLIRLYETPNCWADYSGAVFNS